MLVIILLYWSMAFLSSLMRTYSLSVWATKIEPGPHIALCLKPVSLGVSLPKETGVVS